MLLELGMAGLAIVSERDTYQILIFASSLFAAICNFLEILLPNLSNCKYLSYEYINPSDDKVPVDDLETPAAQPFIQRASPDFPPQNVVEVPSETPMVPVYNYQNEGYNSASGNKYDAPPGAPPSIYTDQNIHGNMPPLTYPNPE